MGSLLHPRAGVVGTSWVWASGLFFLLLGVLEVPALVRECHIAYALFSILDFPPNLRFLLIFLYYDTTFLHRARGMKCGDGNRRGKMRRKLTGRMMRLGFLRDRQWKLQLRRRRLICIVPKSLTRCTQRPRETESIWG